MGTAWESVRFFALLGFLLLCLLGGGAARADVSSLLYLRPAAILCLLVLLLSPGEWEFRRFRTLFILLAIFAATMLIQLIPLPPALWASLPGFGRYTEAAAAAGVAESWRPISLAPDLTLNSLLALLPCLVVLVGVAGIREDQRRILLPVLIAFAAADAMLSVAQFAGGPESMAYLYSITNTEAPVGFFSNRNHNAVFLALALPMLAVWIGGPAPSRQYRRTRSWVAVVFALFLMAMILATGSRAGVVAGGVGFLLALWLAPSFTSDWAGRWRNAFRIGVALVPILLIALAIYTNRATSLFRMADAGGAGELRVEALPVLTDMLKTFSPQGIGYGAFDPVYRSFEPDSLLSTEYFNHAHNDLIELLLTGGVLALLILLVFVIWWGKSMLRTLATGNGQRVLDKLAVLGGLMIVILLGASLVDYPLRTPLLAVTFTIACCWLAVPRPGAAPVPADDTAPPDVGGAGPPRLRVLPALIGVAAAAALGWLAIGVTAAGVYGRKEPSRVAWWPLDATARANRASRIMEAGGRPSPAIIAAAAEEARAALLREPVNAMAARTLGLLTAAQGKEAQANRLLTYAETLSRRDVPTQLWMIESNVRRNDIAGALRHYNRALLTSVDARELLFPILIQAAASEGVTQPLARLVASRPGWWRPFVSRLAAESQSPAAIETVIVTLGLNPAVPEERVLLGDAIRRLVELGDYPRALSLYRRAGGAADALVRNGGFEAENRFMPLDWVLGDGGGTSGIMQPGPQGAGRVLLMMVEPGSAGGTVARQLLALQPGAYRFGAVAGQISGNERERPKITLSCARTNVALFDLRLPASGPGGQPVAQDFTIGNACPAQWLVVSAAQPTNENGPWIDRISIQPRP